MCRPSGGTWGRRLVLLAGALLLLSACAAPADRTADSSSTGAEAPRGARAPTAPALDAPLAPQSGEERTTAAHATPVAPAVPFDGSVEEFFVALTTCLEDAGWAVEIDPSGNGINFEGGAAGAQDEQRAVADCQQQVGGPPAPPAVDEALARAVYEFHLGTRECLIEHGYSISPPPSDEQFIDTYVNSFSGNDPAAPWSPYIEVDPATEAEWAAINEACPQSPPGM